MRTALLAAVSHDLRTPLASIKASVSSLRQTDVAVDRGRPGGAARHDRGERGPARRADRQPARHEPPAHRLAAAVPAPDRDRRGGAARAARARRTGEPAARGARRPAAGAGRPGPAGAGPGQPVLQRAAHSPPTQPPALQARRIDGTVVLEVIDHGPGVPDERKARSSSRSSGSTNTKAGVGLGLAVAKGFTEAMGGGSSRPTRRAAGSRSGSRCRSRPGAPSPCRAPNL